MLSGSGGSESVLPSEACMEPAQAAAAPELLLAWAVGDSEPTGGK